MAHEAEDYLERASFREIGRGRPRTPMAQQVETYYRRFQREVSLSPGSDSARLAYRTYREFRDRAEPG
jgi:hypothetical protein